MNTMLSEFGSPRRMEQSKDSAAWYWTIQKEREEDQREMEKIQQELEQERKEKQTMQEEIERLKALLAQSKNNWSFPRSGAHRYAQVLGWWFRATLFSAFKRFNPLKPKAWPSGDVFNQLIHADNHVYFVDSFRKIFVVKCEG